MIQNLSGSWYIKGTSESMTRADSPVPLIHHDPDRSWITDPNPDHSKGTQPKLVECFSPLLEYSTASKVLYNRTEHSRGFFICIMIKNPMVYLFK